MKKLIFCIYILFSIRSEFSFSQINPTVKRDTLYYLVDTASVPTNDRILEIKDAPLFKFYYFKCQCLYKSQMPYLIHRTNQKVEYMSPDEIKEKKIISTSKLLYLFHTDYNKFNIEHTTYILEVLPDRRIIKHLVITGAITMSTDDLELIPK